MFIDGRSAKPSCAGLAATTCRGSRSTGWRHTWATLVLERGIHPKVVQERLGHSTIAIALGIYSHLSPTLHDEAAERVVDPVMPSARRRE